MRPPTILNSVPLHPRPPHRGFALVSTVLVVAFLTIMVVAFLQSMRIDQLTARSYLNKTRADEAAAAGITKAIDRLLSLTETDNFIVLREDASNSTISGPYYFIGTFPESTGSPAPKIVFHPLFSNGGASSQTEDLKPNHGPGDRFMPHPDPNKFFPVSTANPALNEPRLPRELWKSGASTGPTTYWESDQTFRFTYWIEDLGGLLDADIVGNLDGPGETHRRQKPEGKPDPDEIPLYNLFEPTAGDSASVQDHKEIIQYREGNPILTSDVLRHLISLSGLEKTHLLTTGLPNDTIPELIPFGFTFPREGQPKVALNPIISIGGPSAVERIREAINDNLPQFGPQRCGGMESNQYLNNIAASIIDYADPDSTPTTGPGYRGIDLHPFMTQWFMWTQWKSRSSTSSEFIIHHYLELWNMNDKPAEGTLTFEAKNNYTVTIGSTLYKFGSTITPHTSTINLQPNEYKVLLIGQDVHNVATVGAPGEPLNFPFHSDSNYTLKWNGVTIDRAPGGVRRLARSVRLIPGIAPATNATWSASIPGFIYHSGSSFLNGNVGDPRISFFLTGIQDANAYDTRASSGGRVVRFGLESNSYGQVLTSAWPDPKKDFSAGTRIGGNNRLPTSVPPPSADPLLAVAHIANYSDGKLRSVAELGNIFDSGLWRQYNGTAGGDPATDAWKDIIDSTDADANYGGGRTLRIGRPEFTRFNKLGIRASDLLAIFSTDPTRPTKGLVNLNTAPREVLQALGAGLNLSQGEKTEPNEIREPTINSSRGSRFADAVLRNRPFTSTHQLATMTYLPEGGGGGETFFGNRKQWRNSDTTPPHRSDSDFTWRDLVAERYFRNIYDLVTVQSRNFRIYVTGQAIQTSPSGQVRVLGTSRKVVTVSLIPDRDENGNITKPKATILESKDL